MLFRSSRKNAYKIIREIKNCDLLISGGGSLLQDVTSCRSIIYYLSIMLIGILFNKKVMVYSQGIGPINKSLNKWITRFVLNKVDYITLRDYKSERVLKEINIKNKNIIVTSDPVIGLKQKDINLGKEILINSGIEDMSKPIIAFAVRGREKNKNTIDVISMVTDKIGRAHV